MDKRCWSWCWFWFCVADPYSGVGPGARSASAPGIADHNTLHLKGEAAEFWSLSIPWAVCPECCLTAELPHALCKYSKKCRSWEHGFVTGILAPCGRALVRSCRRTSLCHHPDHSQAVLLLGVGWKCPAALLPSFGSWDVIRKEKRENGLFLPKPFPSFGKKTERQTWNHGGNQNKHSEHMTLSEMFLLSFWIVLCLIISSGGNQHFMGKCFPISFA